MLTCWGPSSWSWCLWLYWFGASREFPAIFWDVVGGNGVIFRGLDASIHASRPIWLLWCFDHDQFDDPLDVILQKCGRKCYLFFHPEAFDFAGWLIFQKLGGKRWDFHHRGNRMPSAFAVPRPSETSQRYLSKDGMALTSRIHVLESDIYQAGGFLGLLASPRAMSKPWIHDCRRLWLFDPLFKNLRKRIQNMQAGQGVKLVFYSLRFVNCDLSVCSIGRDARVVSCEILWKVGASENWSTADGEWWTFLFVVGKQHGEHFFFLGPSSALNLATGNMTPCLFCKIKQPELQPLGVLARTYEVEVSGCFTSAMKTSPCFLESDPHHPGPFLGVTDLQIRLFCNSKFQAAVMNLTRRRMFGSIHLSFFWFHHRAGNLVILVYEAQELELGKYSGCNIQFSIDIPNILGQ